VPRTMRPKGAVVKVHARLPLIDAGLRWLVKHRLSDNAGGVKQISSVLVRALGRARHFALVEELPYQPRLARNPFQVRNSVRPMHLFGHNLDHDYYFRLPGDRGAGYPINYSVFKRTPSRCPGCPACEPNFFNCS